jgi:hypothetical protein
MADEAWAAESRWKTTSTIDLPHEWPPAHNSTIGMSDEKTALWLWLWLG